jgi:hypothetical protein
MHQKEWSQCSRIIIFQSTPRSAELTLRVYLVCFTFLTIYIDVVYAPTSSVDPIPWNQWLAKTNGYQCNHLTEDGGFFKPPQVKIALLYMKAKAHILTAQLLAIEEINLDNLLGRVIVPIIINLESWDDAFIRESLVNFTAISDGYIKDEDVELMGPIFSTSLSAPLWEKWESLSSEILSLASTKPLVYAPPTIPPRTCAKHTIYFGPSVIQRLQPLKLYLFSQSIDGLVIVQNDESDYTKDSVLYAESLCSGKVNCLGNNLLSSDNDIVGLDAMFSTLAASGASRIVILNLIPGSSENIPSLFGEVESLNAKILETNQRFFVISTMVDERELINSMRGHWAVSSYFQYFKGSTNFAFKSTIAGRNGENFVLTEETEKAYSAIRTWASSVEIAETFEHSKVRVSGYNVSFLTPAGDISIANSNALNLNVYFASVTLLGDSLFYRVSENSIYLQEYTAAPVLDTDACYFGPKITRPDEITLVRIPAIGLLILMDLALIFAATVIIKFRSSELVKV